jgi:hypothetical protein
MDILKTMMNIEKKIWIVSYWNLVSNATKIVKKQQTLKEKSKFYQQTFQNQ